MTDVTAAVQNEIDRRYWFHSNGTANVRGNVLDTRMPSRLNSTLKLTPDPIIFSQNMGKKRNNRIKCGCIEIIVSGTRPVLAKFLRDQRGKKTERKRRWSTEKAKKLR